MSPRSQQSIEKRLNAIEDVEAIKRLKHEYCFALDRRDWDGVARLFAKKGVADYGPIGKSRGREKINEFFRTVISEDFTFFAHMAHNPIIDVKGNRGTGRWYFEIPSTVSPNKARWITGWYDDKYVKENGEWKFAYVKSSYFYISSYEKGWGKEKFIEQP